MKAITLWEPWATLWIHGAKLFETRPWRTHHQGPIAVHAAVKWESWQRELCFEEPFYSALVEIAGHEERSVPDPIPQHRGCILGVGRLVGCHNIDARFRTTVGMAHGQQELEFGDWDDGRYAWELVDRQLLEVPKPWRGSQGVWTLPQDWRQR